MDVGKVLAALRLERAEIDEVIVNLERLEQGRLRRRGRPPAILTTPRKRGRPPGSKNKISRHAANAAAGSGHPRVMAAGHSALADESVASTELI